MQKFKNTFYLLSEGWNEERIVFHSDVRTNSKLDLITCEIQSMLFLLLHSKKNKVKLITEKKNRVGGREWFRQKSNPTLSTKRSPIQHGKTPSNFLELNPGIKHLQNKPSKELQSKSIKRLPSLYFNPDRQQNTLQKKRNKYAKSKARGYVNRWRKVDICRCTAQAKNFWE